MISFQNDGLIDKRAITIMGISSKEGDNPIGFFGTGLKYAIAIVLRHGGQITIWRGLEKLEFRTEREQVRVDEFDIIYMNDQQLGYTTNLGRTWEPWMCFRELYCNTLDEDGLTAATRIRPVEGSTTVHVSKFPEFEECHGKRSSFMLETRPLYSDPVAGVEVHPGASQHIYYRGIMAGVELPNQALYTYNITAQSQLTEDRTLRFPERVLGMIGRMVAQGMHDEALLRNIISAKSDSWEHQFNIEGYNNFSEMSDTFVRVVEAAIKDPSTPINQSAQSLWFRQSGRDAKPKEIELNAVQRAQLRRAMEFCARLGYPVNVPVLVVRASKQTNKLGWAELHPEQRIIVTERVFEMGTKMLAGTLLEENWHVEFSFNDMTRDFQNFLVDQIVSLGERLDGEAL